MKGSDNFNTLSDKQLMSDDELVLSAKRELPYVTQSYEYLMLRYEKLIRNVIYGVVKDSVAVDDVLQEVMIKVFNKVSLFEGRSSFKTWLMTICMNTSISYLRKNKRNASTESLEQNETPIEIEDESSRVDTDSFEKMIVGLDEKERQIVTLKFVAELEFQEIATALDLGLSAVKMRYYRAVEKLKQSSD